MTTTSLVTTAQILKDLRSGWNPHPAQRKVLKSIFLDGCKGIYVDAGRKFGKSELLLYCMWRYALTHPNSGCYYYAPEQKQGREILWASKRAQTFVPKKYIASINNTEMRITTIYGSFLKFDGSNNYEAARGIQPHFLGLDEIKDFDPAFFPAMMPNLAVFNAPCVIIGTPPESEGLATELKDEYEKDVNKTYFNFPSSANPHISKEWLDREKESLFAKGDEDVWFREYEAKFVRGGKNAIFPMLEEDHFYPHDSLMDIIKNDKHKIEWYVTADPGSTSVFAVLFVAINPNTKDVFVLDEIYETNQLRTSASLIIPRIDQKILSLFQSGEWRYTYDEAATWFKVEDSAMETSRPWVPTTKSEVKRDPRTKEPGMISMIKDALLFGKLHISDRCEKLKWEMFNYTRSHTRDGQIKILKRDDHLIDCLRYTLSRAGYSLPTVEVIEPIKKVDRLKMYSIEDDFRSENLIDDIDWGLY